MIQTVWSLREPSTVLSAPPQKLTPLFQKLLSRRGFNSPGAVDALLSPSRADLLDPLKMKGVPEALRCLERARLKGEKILVHGDYDVDGVTGAAILSLTLEKLGIPYETFLPERKRDGYGVSREAIRQAVERKIRFLITVDCGVSAKEEIEFARESGMEVIVLDHHQIPAAGLPPATAVLNPLQEGCSYPFKELSAGGLAFKLAQAALGAEAFELLDLAALSTVADLAPLVGENRMIVKEGLERLSERKRTGIKALSDAAGLRARQLKASHVGFMLGPRINAAGRMSSARTALRLLLTSNDREAASLAQILEQENRVRQQEERKIVEEALAEVERTVNFSKERVILVAKAGWHAGVIGIVASRLVERYYRPAFVVALDGGKGKGSARSVRSFNLFKALQSAAEFLGEFGGHEQAAGFNVGADQIPFLRERLNAHAQSVYGAETFMKAIDIDLEVSLGDLTPQFFRELDELEPHGIGNPKPVFLTRGLQVKKIFNQRGRKIWVTDGVLTYEVSISGRGRIAFDFETASRFDLVYTIGQKRFEGIDTIIFEARDAKTAGD